MDYRISDDFFLSFVSLLQVLHNESVLYPDKNKTQNKTEALDEKACLPVARMVQEPSRHLLKCIRDPASLPESLRQERARPGPLALSPPAWWREVVRMN